MSISERRHHTERLKAKRRFYWGVDRDLAKEPKHLSMAVKTPKPNKCSCCGNPRRYFGKVSLQEKRAPDVAEQLLRC